MIETPSKWKGLSDLKVEGSPHLLDQNSETFFSTLDFSAAWSRAVGSEWQTLSLPVRGSGPPRRMYAVQTIGTLGRRCTSLGPNGMYASPGWQGKLESATVQGLVNLLTGVRTESFIWNVRFDHECLASCLSELGFDFQRTTTHVLRSDREYEEIFAGYSASLRNHVRKARRLGVTVRSTDSLEEFGVYYKVHLQRVEQKGGYSFVFPFEFLSELIKIPRTARFLVAESEGRIVAGGLFLRDGCSVFYLHGALDEQFSHLYPSCAIFDDAIRWACEKGAAFFNFGGSGTIASLEKFKSSWGARPELNWRFEWKNPLWTHLSRLKGALLRG